MPGPQHPPNSRPATSASRAGQGGQSPAPWPPVFPGGPLTSSWPFWAWTPGHTQRTLLLGPVNGPSTLNCPQTQLTVGPGSPQPGKCKHPPCPPPHPGCLCSYIVLRCPPTHLRDTLRLSLRHPNGKRAPAQDLKPVFQGTQPADVKIHRAVFCFPQTQISARSHVAEAHTRSHGNGPSRLSHRPCAPQRPTEVGRHPQTLPARRLAPVSWKGLFPQ